MRGKVSIQTIRTIRAIRAIRTAMIILAGLFAASSAPADPGTLPLMDYRTESWMVPQSPAVSAGPVGGLFNPAAFALYARGGLDVWSGRSDLTARQGYGFALGRTLNFALHDQEFGPVNAPYSVTNLQLGLTKGGPSGALGLAYRWATGETARTPRHKSLVLGGAARVHTWLTLGAAQNLSLQADVRRLAAEGRERHRVLHVLINNAGGIVGRREMTADGIEKTFAGNHLGPFLLTNLLLDRLKAAAPARIVNVASEASRMATLDFDDLYFEKGYAEFKAYARSKLANILFTRELARRLERSGVTAVSLHPGVVRTRFGESGSGFFRFLVKLGAPFFITPEKGADTLLWAATSPDAAGLNGAYLVRRKVRRPVALARNDEVARRLWEASAQLTHLEA